MILSVYASMCQLAPKKIQVQVICDTIFTKTPFFLFLDNIICRQAPNCCSPKKLGGIIGLVQELLVTMFGELIVILKKVNNEAK